MVASTEAWHIDKGTPPRTGQINARCPHPNLVPVLRTHFGCAVWQFECSEAVEVFARDEGIYIKCAALDGACCIEDGKTVFVGSPAINPFKGFLETTLNYFRMK